MQSFTYDQYLAHAKKIQDITHDVIAVLRRGDEDLFSSNGLRNEIENLEILSKNLNISITKRHKIASLTTSLRSFCTIFISFVNEFSKQSQSDFSNTKPQLEELMANLDLFPEQIAGPLVTAEKFDAQLYPDEEVFTELDDIKVRIDNATIMAESNNKNFLTTLSELKAEAKPLSDRYNNALKYFDDIEPELQSKLARLDELLGLAGEKLLAGNYDKQATVEKNSANWLRVAAILLMLIAISPVFLSLLDSSRGTLNMDQALLRLGYSLILSVPAAYLARESTKHRQQQYAMQQTALDVGAIGAYIKPLPDDARNRITESIATKLFSPKNFDHVSKDSYPINVQELISKLVDIAASQRENATSTKDPKEKNEA